MKKKNTNSSPFPQGKVGMSSRCPWPSNDPLMIKYHDEEWGKPLHDDRKLFEFLILESFQAGLSWRTVLYKRENFRKAFANFDAKKVSTFDRKKFNSLMKDAGIIRNRLKIEAAINNAKCFLQLKKEFGSFDKYVWSFTNGKSIINKPKSLKKVIAFCNVDTMNSFFKKGVFKHCVLKKENNLEFFYSFIASSAFFS